MKFDISHFTQIEGKLFCSSSFTTLLISVMEKIFISAELKSFIIELYCNHQKMFLLFNLL